MLSSLSVSVALIIPLFTLLIPLGISKSPSSLVFFPSRKGSRNGVDTGVHGDQNGVGVNNSVLIHSPIEFTLFPHTQEPPTTCLSASSMPPMGPVHYFSVLFMLAPTVGLAQQCHAVQSNELSYPRSSLFPRFGFWLSLFIWPQKSRYIFLTSELDLQEGGGVPSWFEPVSLWAPCRRLQRLQPHRLRPGSHCGRRRRRLR